MVIYHAKRLVVKTSIDPLETKEYLDVDVMPAHQGTIVLLEGRAPFFASGRLWEIEIDDSDFVALAIEEGKMENQLLNESIQASKREVESGFA